MPAHADDELLLTDAGRVIHLSGTSIEIPHDWPAYLAELGVAVGDRVSVQVDKSPMPLWRCISLALRGGFVFHPLNPSYQPAELEYFLGNAAPTIVVCDSRKLAEIQPLADNAGIEHVLTLDADGHGSL